MSLLSYLSVQRKLLLLAIAVPLAISVPSFIQYQQSSELAETAQAERDGIGPCRDVIRLIQLTQHHRGLSAAQLGGNAAVQSKREAKNAEVQQQLARVQSSLGSLLKSGQIGQTLDKGRAAWESLSGEVGSRALSAAQSSTRHAQLIAVYLELLDQLVDQSRLALDPEADTYYLMIASLGRMPQATEAMGQTRARGAGFLAEGKLGQDGRSMLTGLVQQVTDQHTAMVKAFHKSFDASPGIKAALADKVDALGSHIDGALKLTRQELIQAENISYPSADYIATYTQAIDTMFSVNELALNALEQALTDRIKNLHKGNIVMGVLLVLLIAGPLLLARSISRSITVPLRQATELARQIAERRLDGEVEARSGDEIGQLCESLLAMRDSLCQVIQEVRSNAEQVAHASQELAAGNSDLSQRTEQQASALQETASSMEQLTTTVRSNADEAAGARNLAERACNVAEAGGSAVQQVVSTMGDIEASSRRVEEITAVIESIAFQTNILALNAAVEAARAGEQGRGFAVVASEVRALAQRSAEAAKQIKQLISTSVSQVETGARQVRSAGETLQAAVNSVRELNDIIHRISTASAQQSGGLQQISAAVSHMDQLTQQNAALVEETAASGQHLQGRAQELANLVATFRIRP